MLIDCVSFFNEYDILEGRLEYLYDTVDYFLIFESDTTHSGYSKPFNYINKISRYRKYSNKIVYFPLSFDRQSIKYLAPYPPEIAMDMDRGQRSKFINGLKLFDPSDIVMISDLDEIPRKEAIYVALDKLSKSDYMFAFEQDWFMYNLNYKENNHWYGTVISINQIVQKQSVQWMRDMRTKLQRIPNGGWHLTYWGGAEKIKTKIINFCHQEFNKEEFTNIEKINRRISKGLDPFGRSNSIAPFDKRKLPQDFLSIFEKYSQ